MEGAPHTAKRSMINRCVYGVPPAPVYKGAREGEAAGQEEAGGRKERGALPPLLVHFGLEGEGARGLPWPPLLFSTKAHVGPLNPRGVPITPGTPVYIR